jgi:hypothetical protein
MKWFLRCCFLLAFTMLPAMVHANPLPLPPVSLPSAPKPLPVAAPEFDLVTVSGGLAALVGSGWLLLGWRRNRKD